MAFASGVRKTWSTVTGGKGPRRPAPAAHDEQNFLPQDSVVISDRTRRANKLGEGSFAKVYRGEYNGKPCAVKVFKEDVLKKELTPDPGSPSEVEMLSGLKHKNIVQMYGMWLDPHKDRVAVSIVMELCNESLYEFIRRFKGKIVPKEKKLPFLQDIARGMMYLHGLNIVHGDLRSSNVLLCNSEDQTVAKLADFDMARLLDPGTQHHFTTRFTDEDYLPPEVFDHKGHKDPKKKWARLTPKVDVFCFGELVLEMGCGTYPTPTGKFRRQEVLTELQRRDKHLLKLKQSDKESLGSIIRKCLADPPEDRPSFTEILLDVEGHLHKYTERPDLEMLEDLTAECELLRAESVKWEEDAKSLTCTQDMLEEELAKEKAANQDLQINLQKQSKIVELQQQIQTELQEAKEDLNVKTELLKIRDEELKSLVDSEEQMKNELQKKEAEWNDLRETYHKTKAAEMDVQLKRERQEWTSERNALQEALSNKTNELAEEAMKVTNLNEALQQKAVNIGDLQSKSHEQEKFIQDLNCLLLNMQQEKETLKAQRDTFKQERDDAQGSLKASKEYAAIVAKQRDQFQKKLQGKESANANLLKSLNDKEKKMKEQKTNAESSAKEKDGRIAQFRAELQAEKVKVDSMEKAAVQKEKELDRSKKELKRAVEDFESAMKLQQKELDVISEYSKACELERDSLRAEKRVWVQTEADLRESVKMLEDSCSEMEHSRMELNTRLQGSKAEIETAKTQQKADNAKILSLQVELKTEKDKLRNMEETVGQKETEVKRFRADLQAEKDKVHSMEKAALQKENELDQCKTELKSLRAKKKANENTLMKEMKEKLSESEDMKVKLLGEKEDQKKLEAALRDTVNELERQHSELENKLSACEHERETLEREKAEFMHLRQQQVEEKEKALGDKEDHLEQCQEVERKLLELSSWHTRKIKESEEQIQSLKDKLEQARKEREQLRVQETSAREEEASEEQHRTTSLQKENSDLKMQLTDERDEKRKLTKEVEEYRSQVALQRRNAEQKQTELSALTERNNFLDAQLVSVTEGKMVLLDSERQLASKLEEAKSELKRMTDIAEASAKGKEAEFQQLQEALRNQERILVDKKEEAKKLVDGLLCQITELQRERENVRDQLLQAQSQLEAQALTREASVHSHNEMKKRVEIAEQLQVDQKTTIRRQLLDLQERTKEKEALDARIRQLENQLECTSEELSRVQKSLAEKQAEYATIEHAKGQSEAELQVTIEQLQQAQERVAELDEHIQRMTAEKEEAMTRATTAETQNAQLEKDHCSVSTQLDEMTKQYNMAEVSFKALLDEKSDEAEELRAMCSELKNSLAREETTVADMCHSMEALSADKSNLEEKLAREESAKKALKEEAECRQLELQRLYGSEEASRRAIQDLGEMLQKTEVDKQQYFQDKEQLNDRLCQVEELKGQLQEECEYLKGAILDHQATIEEQVTELNTCKVHMDEMSRSMAALRVDKSNLEERLAVEKEEVTQLTEESKQLKGAYESQRQRLLNQLDEESKLKSEADASNEALSNQVTTLEQDLQREQEEHENTRCKHETAEVELIAVNLKLQDKEADLADKMKENSLMEDAQLPLLAKNEELQCRLNVVQEELASSENAQTQLHTKQKDLEDHLYAAQKEKDSLQEMLKTSEAERSVLQCALEQKMANSMAMEEENRRLRENQMDQKKIKQQRQILKKGQAEVQKGLQEVREEKVKLQLEHTSEEQVKKAMEALQTVSKEERNEMAQELQRAVESARSSLATASQKHVDAASKKLESLVSQVKEEWTAHSIKERQQRLTDQEAKPHVPRVAEKAVMASTTTPLQELLGMYTLATFSPPNYLHSQSGQLVVERKQLEKVCHTETISVCTGSLESWKDELPTAFEEFTHEIIKHDIVKPGSEQYLGAVCLVIPYVTFTDTIRLCRLCVCRTPVGCDSKKCFHPMTVVAIAQVALKLGTSCAKKLKSQQCVQGLVYTPTWHCGYSKELEACFDDCKMPPELVPALQQLELNTTMELKGRLLELLPQAHESF